MVTLTKSALLPTLLLAALVAVGCAAPTPSEAPLTVEQLKNAEYVSANTSGKRAHLTDGKYQEELAPGLASKLTIQMLEPYAVGDLNGDGVPDAAVFLATNMGRSGVFVDL
ncbi:MAG: hypothetical protein M1482_08100 [Chloroflexi bacterium]|nr:hypothetical protein [Chloroflexota bacterium]